MTAPQPARPVAPAPIAQNIPAELAERPQWVVWRYEQRKDKWTKVPYTPHTIERAASNRPASWRSFRAAVACYQERPDYFDGIGYMFLASDPYVGGDIDHCLTDGQLSDFAQQHLPATYAEISPSGNGIKFICRAQLASGRKTSKGELYGSGRFFTVTGRLLDSSHQAITDQQQAVETLYAALGGSGDQQRTGSTANGSRAVLAAEITPAAWQEANQLVSAGSDRLMRRVRASAGEGTQLGVVLAGDYAAFHQRWPFVGLYREDGALDESQVRAVVAYGLKGRGFRFAEYAAAMHLTFGRAKPSAELWKQELAALWAKADEPRFVRSSVTPARRVPSMPKGRASDHAALVERVYAALLDSRIGVEALVKVGELGGALNLSRRTITTILAELRASGRIETRKVGRYTGLVVSFVTDQASDLAARSRDLASAVTGRAVTPELRPIGLTLEVEQPIPDAHYSCEAQPVLLAETPEIAFLAAGPIEETCSSSPNCVSSCTAPIASENTILSGRQTLAEVVSEAIEVYGTQPGAIKPLDRVLRYVEGNAPGRWPAGEVEREYKAQLLRRRWSRRDEREAEKARTMRPGALKKRSQVIASQAAEMHRKGDPRAPIWQRRAGIYAAEEARRVTAAEQADRARFGELGYCEQERQAMLELVEQARSYQVASPALARAATLARSSDEISSSEPAILQDAAGLIARLKARRDGQVTCA